MRNRTPPAHRKHQLVLSLSPHCLHLVHFRRSLLGWTRLHEECLPLPEGEEFLDRLQAALSECVLQWKIPTATRVHWVLAGDILGIVPPTAVPATPSAALPFGAGDTRTQPDQFTRTESPSLMWVHKDWVAEIERLSSLCQLELVEMYARAQLFQSLVHKLPGAFKVVLEQQDGEMFLHIFADRGMMLRTRVLDGMEKASLRTIIDLELTALGANCAEDRREPPFTLLAPASIVTKTSDWPGFSHLDLQFSHGELLEKHWRSAREGIVVRPTHDELLRSIKYFSVAAGVIGLSGLGAMLWHDGRLQQQIERDQEQVRKERPKVQAIQAMKSRTLQMADAVQAAKALREKTGAMTSFAHILAHFPPHPAALLYVRTDDDTLAFAGTGDESSLRWLQEKRFPGYGPWENLPLPEFLTESAPAIHLQTRKTPAEAPPPSLAASSAASRTTAP